MRFFPVILILLVSCSPKKQIFLSSGENIVISDTANFDSELNQLVSPYRDKMSTEMNSIIGEATALLDNNRKTSESDLGNWMSDIVYEVGFTYIKSIDSEVNSENCFALLNKGGIRAPINKGAITVGNIFEVMPFNNEIVIVKLEANKVKEILEYLLIQNGQPVSNSKIELSQKLKTILIGAKNYAYESPVYVITSDYLSKGGDQMDFFKNPISIVQTGTLIRDALLEKVKSNKIISAPENSGRIQFPSNNE